MACKEHSRTLQAPKTTQGRKPRKPTGLRCQAGCCPPPASGTSQVAAAAEAAASAAACRTVTPSSPNPNQAGPPAPWTPARGARNSDTPSLRHLAARKGQSHRYHEAALRYCTASTPTCSLATSTHGPLLGPLDMLQASAAWGPRECTPPESKAAACHDRPAPSTSSCSPFLPAPPRRTYTQNCQLNLHSIRTAPHQRSAWQQQSIHEIARSAAAPASAFSYTKSSGSRPSPGHGGRSISRSEAKSGSSCTEALAATRRANGSASELQRARCSTVPPMHGTCNQASSAPKGRPCADRPAARGRKVLFTRAVHLEQWASSDCADA